MDKHYEIALLFPAKSSSQKLLYWYDTTLYSSLVPDHPESSNVVIGASMDGTAGAVPLFSIIMLLYLYYGIYNMQLT